MKKFLFLFFIPLNVFSVHCLHNFTSDWNCDQIESIQEYISTFEKENQGDRLHRNSLKNKRWDLYDTRFQDLALRLTANMPKNEMRHPSSRPLKHLIRARAIAISTRENLGWDGKELTDEKDIEIKRKVILQNQQSSIIYDWLKKDRGKINHQPGVLKTKVFVTQEDTQSAIEQVAKKYPSYAKQGKITAINMANAHTVCGGYQVISCAQEEDVSTNSDGAVVLSNLGQRREDGRMEYLKENHIPVGGNIYYRTTYFTGEIPVTCNMIAMASIDLRKRDSSENKLYFNTFGQLKNVDQYKDRIKQDLRGVLRTAKDQKQLVLVLGATGCGAFRHDSFLEASAWRDVLSEPEFTGHFEEVRFAIYDKKHPETFTHFAQSLTPN